MAVLDYAPYHKYLYPVYNRYNVNLGVRDHYEFVMCRDGQCNGQTALQPYYDARFLRIGIVDDIHASPAGYTFDSATATRGIYYGVDHFYATSYSNPMVVLPKIVNSRTYTHLATSIWGGGTGAQYIHNTSAASLYPFSGTSMWHKMDDSGGADQYISGVPFSNVVGSVYTLTALNDIESGGSTDARFYQNARDITNPSFDTPFLAGPVGMPPLVLQIGYNQKISRVTFRQQRMTHEQIALYNAGLM